MICRPASSSDVGALIVALVGGLLSGCASETLVVLIDFDQEDRAFLHANRAELSIHEVRNPDNTSADCMALRVQAAAGTFSPPPLITSDLRPSCDFFNGHVLEDIPPRNLMLFFATYAGDTMLISGCQPLRVDQVGAGGQVLLDRLVPTDAYTTGFRNSTPPCANAEFKCTTNCDSGG